MLPFEAIHVGQQQVSHASYQLVAVAGVEREFADEVGNQFPFVLEQVDLARVCEHQVNCSGYSQRVVFQLALAQVVLGRDFGGLDVVFGLQLLLVRRQHARLQLAVPPQLARPVLHLGRQSLQHDCGAAPQVLILRRGGHALHEYLVLVHLRVVAALLLPQYRALRENVVPQVLRQVHQVLFVEDVEAVPRLCAFVELDVGYFGQDAGRDVVARDVHLGEVIRGLHGQLVHDGFDHILLRQCGQEFFVQVDFAKDVVRNEEWVSIIRDNIRGRVRFRIFIRISIRVCNMRNIIIISLYIGGILLILILVVNSRNVVIDVDTTCNVNILILM